MKVVIGVNDVKSSDGKTDLITVAKINELGTNLIPPRPAFRRGGKISLRKNRKNLENYLLNFFSTKVSDNQNKEKAIKAFENKMLSQLGKDAVEATKEIIRMKKEVPNAPKTVRRKGFNHPLLEHGTLLENVAYQVIDKKLTGKIEVRKSIKSGTVNESIDKGKT